MYAARAAFLCCAILSLVLPLQALTVSGTVSTQSSTPLPDTVVRALLPSTNGVVASAVTDTGGNYSMSLDPGTYDFDVTPAAGSGYGAARVDGRVITSDARLDFVLVPIGAARLFGRVLDGDGGGVPGTMIRLTPAAGGATVTTAADATGSYAFGVAPGSYRFNVEGYASWSGGAVPGYYYLTTTGAVEVSADTQLDIRLPLDRVTVQVRDDANAPVAGVRLQTDLPWGYDLLISGLAASGQGGYPEWSGAGPVTNEAGEATLWLLHGVSYGVSAIPPDPQWATTTASVSVSGAQTLPIVLVRAFRLYGRVVDGEGNGAAGTAVRVTPASGGATTLLYAGSNGEYGLGVAAGSYLINIEGYASWSASAVPGYYYITATEALEVAADREFDVSLPLDRITVQVRDEANTPVSGVRIQTDLRWYPDISLGGLAASGQGGYPEWSGSGPLTNDSGEATLYLIHGMTYGVSAFPPDTRWAPTNVVATASPHQTLPITLRSALQLHGRVLDGEGNAAAGTIVRLTPASGGSTTTTSAGSGGEYAFAVDAGAYHFGVEGYRSWGNAAVPGYFYIGTSQPLEVTDSREFDLQLPFSRVTLLVRDATNQPVAGVRLQTDLPWASEVLFSGLSAAGQGGYPEWAGSGPVTNADGEATLYLINGATFSLTAFPLPETPFAPINIPNVTISGPRDIVIALQYTHPAPVTTATFSAAPDGDGTYPDGVSVTLSAVAASGYTIAGTSYAIDGAPPQSYVAPFELSGEGVHHLTFSSIDSSGVREVPQVKEVTIRARDTRPPTIHSVSASPDTLWPPNHRMALVTIDAVVTDDTDPAPQFRIVSVESNEREDDVADGATESDWVITGPATVQLRAERNGTGTGRIYTMTIAATDAMANQSTATVTVTVPHDLR